MNTNKETVFWKYHLIWWSISMAYASFPPHYLPKGDWFTILCFELLFFSSMVIATYLYRLGYRKFNPSEDSFVNRILSCLVGSLLVGGIFYILHYPDFIFHFKTLSVGMSAEESLGYYFDCVWFTLPWFTGYHLYRYQEITAYRIKQFEDIERAYHLSELENLRKQLNPHFLFNSLNDIRSLMLSDVMGARDAMLKLSELLRNSIKLGELSQVTLSQELELIDDYLYIEKLRFENRLIVSKSIPESTLSYKIPPISLQLLVENAIKHGIGKYRKGGEIKIVVTQHEGRLILQVLNTGKLNEGITSNSGIGLKNLEKRLSIYYGTQASLSMNGDDEWVVATIQLPISV